MKRIATSLALLSISAAALTGCSTGLEERKSDQQDTQIANSLEKANLKKKRDREENPSAERYLYLFSALGEPMGYYITVGKVSSSGSQMGPEQEVVRGFGGDGYILDSAQDDGTFGTGDPGIFFFTADDVMVETTLDYQLSDAPLAIDTKQLYK